MSEENVLNSGDLLKQRVLLKISVAQTERLRLATELYNQENSDFTGAMSLYDKIEDFDNPEFLNLMGLCYLKDNENFEGPKAALKYFRKAYVYALDDQQRYRIAQNLLEAHYSHYKIEPGTNLDASDPFIAEVVMYLGQTGKDPHILGAGERISNSSVFSVRIYGEGIHTEKDEQKIFDIENLYIDDTHGGYLSWAFSNLCIRHVLGLQGTSDLATAKNLLSIRKFSVQGDKDNVLENQFLKISDFISKLQSNNARGSLEYYINRYKRTNNAWEFLRLLQEESTDNKIENEILVGTVRLFTILAHNEKWSSRKDWLAIYNYTLNQAGLPHGMNISYLTDDLTTIVEAYNPIIRQQEHSISRMRQQRVDMYEYFHDNELGVPPVDPQKRYELALKFKAIGSTGYDAISFLFDPEEDYSDKNWLYLMGQIYDSTHTRRHDPLKALQCYERASMLGHPEAAYIVAENYELGVRTDVNLHRALGYYKLAEKNGYEGAFYNISLLTDYLTRLSEITSDPKVEKKIFNMYGQFMRNGLGVFPLESEDRRQKALEYLDAAPRNFNMALAMYFPELDGENHQWLLFQGVLHDLDENNPYFDAEKAFEYFIKSAEKGNSSACYNLGVKYAYGKENEIDIDGAVFWWGRAFDLGDSEANFKIASLMIEHDHRYYSADEKEFRADIHRKILSIAEENSFAAMHKAANIQASGRNGTRNDQEAIKFYMMALLLAPPSHQTDYKNSMLFNLALRAYLGVGIDKSNDFCLTLLSQIDSNTRNNNLRENVKKFRAIIYDESRNPALFIDNTISVRRAYEADNVPHGNSLKGPYAIDIAWCAQQLAIGEEWLNRYEWERLAREIQARNLGLSYESIIRSTMFEGPRYNRTSINGMPVLGAWESASKNSRTADTQMLDRGSYVPEAGVVKFDGVKMNKEGTVTFDFTKASDQPAFLVPEDFQIALILAFGNPDSGINPYLSLENPNRHGISDKYECFKFKEWKPHWLGYTDFGRTLYITDQLIADLCWNTREFDIADRNEAFDPRVPEYALSLTNDIVMTGGRTGAGGSVRVMLRPDHIGFEDNFVDTEGNLRAYIAQLTMRVDGDYVIVGESKDKDLRLNTNDNMYQQGRTVNKLSSRYNDIAAMMPVFARGQELMRLLHSCLKLRELTDHTGTKLNSDWQNRIRRQYREFESLPQLPKHELLCVPLPLEFKRV